MNILIMLLATFTEEQENDGVDTNNHTNSLPMMSTCENKMAPMRKLHRKTRHYKESYLKFGFTTNIINNEARPICTLCNEMLSNASMKPSYLLRHLKTKHTEHEHKPLQYFAGLLKKRNPQTSNLKQCITINDKYFGSIF